MAKKKNAAAAKPENNGGIDRDLVVMHSRLTHTLENVCGRDNLAKRLADLRKSVSANDDLEPALPALTRTFRRLGLIGPDNETAAFARELAVRTGEAVSRPADHIGALWLLFARGDAAAELKPVCGATPQCQSCQLTRECEHFNNPRQPEMALLPPPARLLAGYEQGLSDAELLAVFLFGEKGTGREEVVATLLARYGRLRAIFRAEAHEYQGIRDMGRPQALRLAATAVLHRRLMAERRDEMLHIGSAQDIYDRYAVELQDYRTEAVVLLLLDQQNNVMRDVWFCEGSPTMAQVGIADLLRPAVREFAPRIAIVHNHPSNNPKPSTGDLDFTRRLRSACDLIGLVLVDHVVACESGYFSFAEKGMLGL